MRFAVYVVLIISFVLLQSCATDPRIVAEQQKAKIAKQSLKETPKWFKKL